MADDDTEPDDIEPDDDNNDDEEEEYKPPTKEEWAKVQAALSKANAEAKQRRIDLKNRDAAERERKAGSEDADAKMTAARAEWQRDLDDQIIRERAATRLAAAGLHVPDGQDAEDVVLRAVRLLDLDSVTRTKTGKVEGLSEAIDELREKMPALFNKRGSGASRERVGSASGGAGREATATGKGAQGSGKGSASSKLAAAWRGGQ